MTKQKTGDESQLELAIKTPPISKCSVDEIKQVLRLVMIKVGLRSQNWPEEQEKAVLIEHIVSNYGGHTVAEIKLAFELGIAGKLQFGENESIVAFENFSCLYFSSVMNAYRRWSAQVYRQIEPNLIEKPPQKIFTQAEIEDGAREDAERQYQLFLKGHELRGLQMNKEILEKDGLLKEGEGVIDFFTRSVQNLKPNIYTRSDNV